MLQADKANMLNAAVLIIMGFWGFLAIGMASYTALIPVVFGALLAFCQPGVKKENKVIAHVAVVLTLLILLAMLGMRLPKAIAKGEAGGLFRTVAMVITSAIALVAFIKSFIDARKNRAA